MDNDQTYFHHFTIKWRTDFGKAIYISGSIPDLGEWEIERARRLNCYGQQNWVITLPIPLNKNIEYKFFESDYEFMVQKIVWEKKEKNHVVKVKSKQVKENSKKESKFMSFNLRYENKNDVNEFSWDNRKANCVSLIREYQPGFIGVQEAIKSQRVYLVEELKDAYEYIGKARDKKNGEECGVFIERKKYFALQHGFEWISQSREEGSVGFDAKLPRYFTYVILLDKNSPDSLVMAVNVHLDHVGEVARLKGAQYIVQRCKKVRQAYSKNADYSIDSFIVVGDMNIEEEKIMDIFADKEMGFVSGRRIAKTTDKSLTFNGFKNKYILKVGQILMNNKLTIDHAFLNFNEEKIEVSEFAVLKSGNKIVSDHYPIMCSLRRKI